MSTNGKTLRRSWLLLAAVVGLMPPPLYGQTWSSLINQSETPAGIPDGYQTGTINVPKINGVGGWAIVTNITHPTDPGNNPVLSTVYGAVDGITPPTFLRIEGTFGGITQTSFNTTNLNYDDLGRSLYRAIVTGGTGETSVFLDDDLFIQEGTFIVGGHLDGYEWDLVAGPDLQMTRDGTVWHISRIISPLNVQTESIFIGNYTELYGSDFTLPGMFAPLDADSSCLGGLIVSPNGLEYLVEGELETTGTGVTTANDEFMIMSGSPMIINGVRYHEGQPIPGGGENFTGTFDVYAINDFGNFILNIDGSGPTAADEILIVNGDIALREGQNVGGFVLGSNCESVAINQNGDWIAAWNLNPIANGEAIYLNGQMILRRGDAVDLDGNGDPNDDVGVMSAVSSFQGYGIQISDRDELGNVTVYANLSIDTNGTPATGEVSGLYRATFSTGAPSANDLEIRVAASPDPLTAVPGQIEYTVSVRNNSPTSSTGVVVTSSLPAGVAYNSGDPITAPSGNDVIGTIGDMGPYEIVKYKFLCDATTEGTKTVDSTVAANESDPIPANNTFSISTLVQPIVEVGITIQDSPDPLNVHDGFITYTVTVTNAGPAAATGVIAELNLNGTTNYTSSDPVAIHNGTFPGGVVTADITGPGGLNGPLAFGQSFQFQVVVQVTTTGAIAVTGTVNSNEVDRTPANNIANASTTYALTANLSITMTDNDPIIPGGDITYVVTVANAGPSMATGVVADVILDTSTTLVSVDPPGAPNGPNVQAAIGNIPPSSNVSFNVVVSTTGKRYTIASASVAGSGVENDPSLANNSTAEVTQALAHGLGLPRVIFSNIDSHASSDVPDLPGVKFRNFKTPWRSPNGQHWILVGETNLNDPSDDGNASGDSDGSRFEDDVIIRSLNGVIQTVAQQAVTLDELGVPYGVFDEALTINDNGDFAFATNKNNLDVTGLSAELIVKNVNGIFTTVAREDEVNDTLFQLYNFDLRSPVIQSDGTVWFYALLGADVNSITGRVFLSNDGDVLQLRNANGYTPQGMVINPTWQWFDFDRYAFSSDATGANYLVRGRVSSTAGGGSFRRILATGVAGGGPAGTTAVIEEGVAVAGFTSPVRTGTSAAQSQMMGNGDWYARGQNQDNQDWVIRNGSVLVKTGDPIHVGASEVWSDSGTSVSFFTFTGNNAGDYVVGGFSTTPDTLSDAMLVMNNERIVVRENTPVDLDGNGIADDGLYIRTFDDDGSVDLMLDEQGRLYFVCTLRDSSESNQIVANAFVVVDVRCPGIYGDINDDNFVNGADLQEFTDCLLGVGPPSPLCRCADINGDGNVDIDDVVPYAELLTNLP